MPPKGKPATKGQKQIIEENKSTLQFYRYIMLGVSVLYFSMQYIFFWESFTVFFMMLSASVISVYIGCYKFLLSMASAKYTPEGAVIDGGIDLNMESGVAEHVKDVILLTAIVQILSLLSNYFWLLWLTAPGYAFYLLWVNFLGPWFFAPAPEADDKKMKKMERKMKRH